MTTVEVFAPAKINLTLHVTGQREDGYHELDSLVAFAHVGDRLTFARSSETHLTVNGPFAADVPAGSDNLIRRAAELMGLSAAVTLEKNLPVAAGIGGGSADAAATLHGLAKLHSRTLPDTDALLSLGTDVPVCVVGGLVRMRGIGDRLDRIATGQLSWPLVLVNPNVPISTRDVFSCLESKSNAPMDDPFELGPVPHFNDEFPNWLARQRNDLEAPARKIAPVIDDVLAMLRQQDGCQLARMSGSGATCFALFDHESKARSAAGGMAAKQPDWWVAMSDQPGF